MSIYSRTTNTIRAAETRRNYSGGKKGTESTLGGACMLIGGGGPFRGFFCSRIFQGVLRRCNTTTKKNLGLQFRLKSYTSLSRSGANSWMRHWSIQYLAPTLFLYPSTAFMSSWSFFPKSFKAFGLSSCSMYLSWIGSPNFYKHKKHWFTLVSFTKNRETLDNYTQHYIQI